jgi:hypothetical protein
VKAAPKAEAWIDGKPAAITNGQIKTTLPAGPHTLVLKLEPQSLHEFLRVETADATFLAE